MGIGMVVLSLLLLHFAGFFVGGIAPVVNRRPHFNDENILHCCYSHHFILIKDAAQVTVNDSKTADGACYLKLKVPSRSRKDSCWDFLGIYGYRYGDGIARPLPPSELLVFDAYNTFINKEADQSENENKEVEEMLEVALRKLEKAKAA
ncbi:hypothetical protein Tco_0817714 [Tanacetum coccineum]